MMAFSILGDDDVAGAESTTVVNGGTPGKEFVAVSDWIALFGMFFAKSDLCD
jgi:hypothetical protein